MTTILMENRLPSEVGDSAEYNRLQMRRAIQARGAPTPEVADVAVSELLRVLIVDDYRSAADTLALLVKVWGHDVRCAYGGTSAMALAAEFQPNVMLLDISMPNMSGLELAAQVRRQPRLSECFMIAVTGHTDALHRLQSEEAGIDLFLIKPVDASNLQTLLMWESEYVRKSRQANAAHSVHATTLPLPIDSNSHWPVHLPYYVLPATVAGK